jgi:hypothetical protein
MRADTTAKPPLGRLHTHTVPDRTPDSLAASPAAKLRAADLAKMLPGVKSPV